MDRNVTVRFYLIESVGHAGLLFADALRQAWARPLAERESEAGDGVVMRLEHLEEADGLLLGDLTRVQTENLPSHPTHQASDPLPIDRLGHHTAFCFDPLTRVIALQFDIKMAVGKLCRYARAFGGGKRYSYVPVLQQGALERFEHETPTKFTVKVAKVNQFANFNDELTDFERGFEQMGALFDAPMVEITVTARGRDGGLDKNSVVQCIRRLLGLKERFNGIRSITASTDETNDPFNFLRHLLKNTELLDLPANEPAVARLARIGFTRRCIDDQLDYLRAAYGADDVE